MIDSSIKKNIDIALVGYGYWGKILEQYISVRWNVKYICDKDYSISCEMEDILEDKELKIVFVCTPVSTHYRIVKDLIKAKKNVFCEKPLCLEASEAKELINLAHENGVCLFVDYIYCYSNSFIYFMENIREDCHVNKVVFSMKQFGKFYLDCDCFESLAVHFLAIAGYLKYNCCLLGERIISIRKEVYTTYNNIPSRGCLHIDYEDISFIFNISLDSFQKDREILFVTDDYSVSITPLLEKTIHYFSEQNSIPSVIKEVSLDEKNNIINVLNEFEKVLEEMDNKENEYITLFISEIFELLKRGE